MVENKQEVVLEEGEYEVGSIDELAENDRLITEIEGREIAVFHENGEYYAVANYCPHQAGPLCEGPVTGRITADDDMIWKFNDDEKLVTCPWHYWKFDISTGRSVKDEQYKVPTYDVEIRKDKIVVTV